MRWPSSTAPPPTTKTTRERKGSDTTAAVPLPDPPVQGGKGLRSLRLLWSVVLVAGAGGALTLQILGPPSRPPPAPPAPRPAATAAAPVQAKLPPASVLRPAARTTAQDGPGRSTPGPIADPDPALLEPAPDFPDRQLPRIAEDGRRPMQVYAAGYDPSSHRPRVGLLLAGMGVDMSASAQAVRLLPGGVTLAVSPYARSVNKLLAAARMAEHEYLVSIPIERRAHAADDLRAHALTTRTTPAAGAKELEWALSRFEGYIGATAVPARVPAERPTAVPDGMDPMLQTLARRGLLYIGRRPDGARLPFVWSRGVDLVIDVPDSATAIDAKLAELDRIAEEKGSALGLAEAPRTATVERIAAWANGLDAKGLALAPVSALAQPPAPPVAGQ